MKAVFLCGGASRRMFPVTGDKFLLKFLGKTLLEHQMELAAASGIREFVIVAGPRNITAVEGLAAAMPGMRAQIVVQQEPRGIADALKSAAARLDDEIMVVNPNDVFQGAAYTGLMSARRTSPAASHILGCKVSGYFPGGYLEVEGDGRLRRIIEKPGQNKQPSNLVNILVHLHRDPERLLRYIGGVAPDGDGAYERALDRMAAAERSVRVVPYSGTWTPIKYPWHVLAAARHFLELGERHIAPTAVISDRATVEGAVVLGENVRVMEDAVVRGPAYIGPNSVIGNGSLVRAGSHIGADCVVGFSTEVKGSYVGDGCWFHMCYVGDSVVGEGCSFGANTVLANWRFDERTIRVRIGEEMIDSGLDKLGAMVGGDCRTGVNASIMPGLKVGPGSTVAAQTCLTGDLPPERMAVAGGGYREVANRCRADYTTADERMRQLVG